MRAAIFNAQKPFISRPRRVCVEIRRGFVLAQGKARRPFGFPSPFPRVPPACLVYGARVLESSLSLSRASSFSRFHPSIFPFRQASEASETMYTPDPFSFGAAVWLRTSRELCPFIPSPHSRLFRLSQSEMVLPCRIYKDGARAYSCPAQRRWLRLPLVARHLHEEEEEPRARKGEKKTTEKRIRRTCFHFRLFCVLPIPLQFSRWPESAEVCSGLWICGPSRSRIGTSPLAVARPPRSASFSESGRPCSSVRNGLERARALRRGTQRREEREIWPSERGIKPGMYESAVLVRAMWRILF